MTSLRIPDINVWLAILLADHTRRLDAQRWWQSDSSTMLALNRFTQLGVLRLLTTAAAMNDRPLTMSDAWASYDALFEDDRVAFLDEPEGLERHHRVHSAQRKASPKRWGDA